MIITRNQIAKYLRIENISDKELCFVFNSIGLEIIGFRTVSNVGLEWAYVENLEPIAGTEHLSWVSLRLLNKKNVHVVCGADNVKAGHLVLYAPVGSTIASGLTLQSKMIKDHLSAGMICSLAELGVTADSLLPSEQDGIFTLAADNPWCPWTKAGAQAILASFQDTVFELELPLNRSDCLSLIQIVQELSRYLNIPAEISPIENNFKASSFSPAAFVEIPSSVKNDVVGLTAVNIVIDHTMYLFADWVGMRFCDIALPLSNPWVLIEQLLMLETGYPVMILPAANTKKAPAWSVKKIIAAQNTKNYLYQINDLASQKTYILGQSTPLPLSSDKKALLVIVLVKPSLMRIQQKLTNQYSGLFVTRAIKPVSPGFAFQSIWYFMEQYSQFKPKIMQVQHYLKDTSGAPQIPLSTQQINDFLGTTWSTDLICEQLRKLNFKVMIKKPDDLFMITPPLYRQDITMKADVCEELVRAIKLVNLPTSNYYDIAHLLKQQQHDDQLAMQLNSIKHLFTNSGFYQIENYNLVASNENQFFNFFNAHNQHVVNNPLTKKRSEMRTTLIPALLQTAQYNNHRKISNTKLFAINILHNSTNQTEFNQHVAFGVQDFVWQNSLHQNIPGSYYFVKGFLAQILDIMAANIEDIKFEMLAHTGTIIHPYQSVKLFYQKQLIGVIVRLHPALQKNMKMQTWYGAEINLSLIAKLAKIKNQFISQSWSKFSPIRRDLNIYDDLTFDFVAFKKQVLKTSPLCCEVTLHDLYRENNESQTQKLTVRLDFNSSKHQLTESDVDKEFAKIKALVA